MIDLPDVPDPRIRAAAESFPLLDIGGDIVVQSRKATEGPKGFYRKRVTGKVLWDRTAPFSQQFFEAVAQHRQILPCGWPIRFTGTIYRHNLFPRRSL
jgi:hypothetical protein